MSKFVITDRKTGKVLLKGIAVGKHGQTQVFVTSGDKDSGVELKMLVTPMGRPGTPMEELIGKADEWPPSRRPAATGRYKFSPALPPGAKPKAYTYGGYSIEPRPSKAEVEK